MRLTGVLDHLRGHAAALEREVHLLAFLVGDALIDFTVHEEGRRPDVAGVGDR